MCISFGALRNEAAQYRCKTNRTDAGAGRFILFVGFRLRKTLAAPHKGDLRTEEERLLMLPLGSAVFVFRVRVMDTAKFWLLWGLLF